MLGEILGQVIGRGTGSASPASDGGGIGDVLNGIFGVAAAPEVSEAQRRVELCGGCSGYTKVIDVREPAPFPLLAIADLATMHLDEGAMNRGYRRPELFDLDAIEPRTPTC